MSSTQVVPPGFDHFVRSCGPIKSANPTTGALLTSGRVCNPSTHWQMSSRPHDTQATCCGIDTRRKPPSEAARWLGRSQGGSSPMQPAITVVAWGGSARSAVSVALPCDAGVAHTDNTMSCPGSEAVISAGAMRGDGKKETKGSRGLDQSLRVSAALGHQRASGSSESIPPEDLVLCQTARRSLWRKWAAVKQPYIFWGLHVNEFPNFFHAYLHQQGVQPVFSITVYMTEYIIIIITY